MVNTVISGTGLFTPAQRISNQQLVESYNAYVQFFNEQHAAAIAAGEMTALAESSVEFIEKASGIQSRYVMQPNGMLEPTIMQPMLNDGDELEVVTMGLAAAKQALAQAGKTAADIDLVIVTTTNHQRPYPSVAVEIQHKLGCTGFAYDMGIACSSATFGLIAASNAIKAGTAKTVLVVNPEFATPQVNLRSRDSHFIFGDVATAAIVELESSANPTNAFRIIHTKQFTQYSDNIRCDGNYTDHCRSDIDGERPYFKQEGRKVFKELLPLVTDFIEQELTSQQLQASDVKRMWLHQANINMNMFAVRKILGRDAEGLEAPIVLNEYANTASAGSMIAFHLYQDDFQTGDKGVLCSFGAGYSIGSLLLEKC